MVCALVGSPAESVSVAAFVASTLSAFTQTLGLTDEVPSAGFADGRLDDRPC
jgi:hypothetical protein